jgi:predicted  nucleic acid-binding Zn-ribbon protein
MIRLSGEIAPEMGEWECMECGYVEEGMKGRRPKKCPECGALASALEFFPDEDDADLDRSAREEYEDEDLEEYDEEESDLYTDEDEGEER